MPEVEVHRFPGDDLQRLEPVFTYFQPKMLILIEAELWPMLLKTAHQKRVPVFIVNARLTPSAFRRYRLLGQWFSAHLSAITWVLAQSLPDAERFHRLGIPRERIRVVGNLKFDLAGRPRKSLQRKDLGLTPEDFVVVFGSLRSREEDLILEALTTFLRPGVKFILAPRHLDRVRPLIQKLQARGWPVRLRQPDPAIPTTEEAKIVILNTLGELWDVYALGDVAVVGGTFAPYGGHSLLEPAFHGLPVVFGPYIENVQEVAKGLLQGGGGIQVQRPNTLVKVLDHLFRDQETRKSIGTRARRFVEQHQGATQRVLTYLKPWLEHHDR